MKIIKNILAVSIGLGLIFMTAVLFAQTEAVDCVQYCSDPESFDPPDGKTCICNPIESGTFEGIITNLIDFIFRIAIVVAPLMIIVGGALFVSAGGDLQKVEQAKKIILWTIVGFIIVLLARGISDLIETIIGI
jgi:hypothetical protein